MTDGIALLRNSVDIELLILRRSRGRYTETQNGRTDQQECTHWSTALRRRGPQAAEVLLHSD